MGLADSFAAIPPKYSTINCQLRRWASALDPDLQALLWAVVYDKDKPTREVAKAICKNGYDVSASTIQGHRNGDCRTCERIRDGAG